MKQSMLFFLPAFLAGTIVSAQDTQNLRGLAVEKAYIACGDAQQFCGSDDVLEAFLDETHEVRCCSKEVFGRGKKIGSCSVAGHSYLNDGKGNYICHHSANFFEAKKICENNGARLCTKEEILSRCTHTTGCMHDLDHIWTSTKVEAGPVVVTPPPTPAPTPVPPPAGAKLYLACGDRGQHWCGGAKTLAIAAPSEFHEVRCCSDTTKPGWRKNAGCNVWGETDLVGVNGGRATCHGKKTYDQAVAICAKNGARLCSKTEIVNKCTIGSGCGYDREMIWTSTIAPDEIVQFTENADLTQAAKVASQPVCTGEFVGTVWGDPHFITFDKLKYDCQGKGEYVIIKSKGSDPLEIHGRFVDGSRNQNGRATVTRSVAIKVDEDVPVVHVTVPEDQSNGCEYYYSVGNEDNQVPANKLIDYFNENYKDQANVYTNGRSTIFTFPDYSARIEVISKVSRNNGCVLRTNVCITPEKHGGADNIVGLLGTPDKNQNNDWMNSTTGELFDIPFGNRKELMQKGFDFCNNNWCVGKHQDSFYSMDTFDKYNKCPEKSFSAESLLNVVDLLHPEVVAACDALAEGDPVVADACKLDVAMDVGTDDKDAGLEAVEDMKDDEEASKKVRELTEDEADGAFEDWTGPKQATTTAPLNTNTDTITATSEVLEVDECLHDLIHLTKDEEDQPLPKGAITVDSYNDEEVTFSITQLWKSDSSISWITPVFKKGDIAMYCDEDAKVNGLVPAFDTEPYIADCDVSTGKAKVTLFVHDGSFKTSAAENEYDCNGWGNDNGIATYEFELSCNGEKICSGEESTRYISPPPTVEPTPVPTAEPTPVPTAVPTPEPTAEPTMVPTPEPTAEPTPGPTAKPESTEDAPIISGSNGDPHFKTWTQEHFEYHGQCDMILTKDATFANNIGLEVQIRTKLVRFWSYIKAVAIRIGDDILEIEGSADPTKGLFYWINLEYQGELKTLGGFPVESWRHGDLRTHFVIDLSSKFPGQKIEIATYREFIRVDFQNGSEESYGNTVGLLGDFKTGKTLARDGVTALDDFYEYGSEWQVLPSEDMLFHDVEQPQFPQKCIVPEDPRGDRRRRLDESNVSEVDAEAACASIKDALDRKDCIYDILATQDLGMVGAY